MVGEMLGAFTIIISAYEYRILIQYSLQNFQQNFER